MDKKTLIKLHNIYDNMVLGNIELAHKELGIIIKEENNENDLLKEEIDLLNIKVNNYLLLNTKIPVEKLVDIVLYIDKIYKPFLK